MPDNRDLKQEINNLRATLMQTREELEREKAAREADERKALREEEAEDEDMRFTQSEAGTALGFYGSEREADFHNGSPLERMEMIVVGIHEMKVAKEAAERERDTFKASLCPHREICDLFREDPSAPVSDWKARHDRLKATIREWQTRLGRIHDTTLLSDATEIRRAVCAAIRAFGPNAPPPAAKKGA